jgi:hypothetical protein
MKNQPERLLERGEALSAFYEGMRAAQNAVEAEEKRRIEQDELVEEIATRRLRPAICRCRGLGLRYADGSPVPHVAHLARRCHG